MSTSGAFKISKPSFAMGAQKPSATFLDQYFKNQMPQFKTIENPNRQIKTDQRQRRMKKLYGEINDQKVPSPYRPPMSSTKMSRNDSLKPDGMTTTEINEKEPSKEREVGGTSSNGKTPFMQTRLAKNRRSVANRPTKPFIPKIAAKSQF